MSLREISLPYIALRQYLYKIKGNSSLVYSLIFAQLFGLLLTIGPTEGMSSSSEFLHVSVKTYTADTVVFLSFVWIITVAVIVTTKQHRNIEFSLVTNRVSSNLSNILLLLTYSIFAGMTSTLMSVLHRIIFYFALDRSQFIFGGFALSMADLVLGILVSSLYMFLLAAVTYLIRVIIEANKVFAIIGPAVFIGLVRTYPNFFENVIKFYVFESSLWLFTLKVLITFLILFGISVLLSNRMEVRR